MIIVKSISGGKAGRLSRVRRNEGIMKRTRERSQITEQSQRRKIPDIHIVDMDAGEEIPAERPDRAADASGGERTALPETPGRRVFPKNIHTVMHVSLAATLLIVISIIIYRVATYGNFISQDEIFQDGEASYGYDSEFDLILPLLDAEGAIIPMDKDGEVNVLLLGNSPFSDDRDSGDGLANMIAERTGANVINCSISGSYMAAQQPAFHADLSPMDAYTPYWLCTLTYTDVIDFYYEDAARALGEDMPPDAPEAVDTLSNLDMGSIDVVAFMYDGTDYLMGHEMYNDANASDITQFTGNLQASIKVLQENFPHIRVIVMSPTYAFGIDENGEYVSSDIQTYGTHYLSTYFNMEYAACCDLGVTFVDNLYVTVTEDNARQYLADNIHLNAEGRKRVADRFIYALNYYGG